MNVCGIDVGVNGGIALWTDKLQVWKMPDNDRDIGLLLSQIRESYNPIFFLEHQQLQLRDLANGRAFNTQKLLMEYGYLKGILAYLGASWCEVAPITWQSRLGLNIRKFTDKTERKNYYKAEASAWYKTKATLWSADAILIMHYGKLMLMEGKDRKQEKKDKKWINEHLHKQEETLWMN